MRRATLLFTLLLLPVMVHAQYVFPLKASTNKRYFVDQNGIPFLMMADAAHRPISNIATSSYATYLDDRKAQGFNAVNLFGPCGGSSSSCTNSSNSAAFDGTVPFTGGTSVTNYDFCTPNSAYWSEVDSFINGANARSMVVLFTPLPWGNGWSVAFQNNTASTTCLGFTGTKNFIIGAYLGNRYKTSNIIWAPGQDFDGSSPPSAANLLLIADFMAGIASTNPAALLSVQLNFFVSWSHQGLSICANPSTCFTEYNNNLSSDFVYTYHETYDGVLQAYNANPTMPVFHGEGNYEGGNNDGLGHLATAFDTRIQAWWAMTSGATGYVFGNTNVEHFVSGWPTSLDTTATAQMQFINRLFSRFPWQTFIPDQTHTLITSGFGTYNGPNGAFATANYCTTTWDISSFAVVFCPTTATLTANMAAFSKPVVAQWYDTTTGVFLDITGSPFVNSGSQTFATPGAHADGNSDWVLVFQAVSTSGILSASRVDPSWPYAGVNGGIPSWPICQTTACNTLSSGTVTNASIAAAISSAPNQSVVLFPVGTFTGISAFSINQNNVVLRGQGADQTKLVFNGSTTQCGSGSGAVNTEGICVGGSNNWVGNINNEAPWTAGFASGTTTITLGTPTTGSLGNLAVGGMIILIQNADNSGFPASADILVCSNNQPSPSYSGQCTTEPPSGASFSGQSAFYRVQAISGNNITIYPPLQAPNWRSTQTTQAWWPTTARTGVGIENMTLDGSAGSGSARTNIEFDNAIGNWVQGVRSIITTATSDKGYHIHHYLAAQTTIQNNYFYGYRDTAQENYSVTVSGGVLVQNNIIQQYVAPIVDNGPGTNGSVIAYNYTTNGVGLNGLSGWTQGPLWHNISDFMTLFEGNDQPKIDTDAIHGTHNLFTGFRNYFHGDPNQTSNTALVFVHTGARFGNYIGNVLGCGTAATCPGGTSPYWTTFEVDSGSSDTAIWNIGSPYTGGSPTNTVGPDTNVLRTLMRWGNYSTITQSTDTPTNSGIRFVNSEVPSGITNFPNSVPASQTLPSSFYLMTKPLWWSASVPYPAAGPDITGGNILGMAGHVNKIPARTCFESLSNDLAYSGSNPPIKSFNANTCYATNTITTTNTLPAPWLLAMMQIAQE